MMRLATWNLNHRVGKVPWQPEAAAAAVALRADLLVLTEYYPQEHARHFQLVLADAGLVHQLLSPDTGAVANRVLIASRYALEQDPLELPEFDNQFPANIAAARLPALDLQVLGIRVPAYRANQRPQLLAAWDWLEAAAAQWCDLAAAMLGDLNMTGTPGRRVGGANFERMLRSGWQRATPNGAHSYFGYSDRRSEIDHILATCRCMIRSAEYVTAVSGFTLAGDPGALSDHAALVADVEVD